MWRVLADAFRNLWLQLVKRYHPELALSQQDKQQRHEMMIAINKAYEDTDAGTLQQIAETGKLPPPKRVQMPGGGMPGGGRGPWSRSDGPTCPKCGSTDTERPTGGFTQNPNTWQCRRCFNVWAAPRRGRDPSGAYAGMSGRKEADLREWKKY